MLRCTCFKNLFILKPWSKRKEVLFFIFILEKLGSCRSIPPQEEKKRRISPGFVEITWQKSMQQSCLLLLKLSNFSADRQAIQSRSVWLGQKVKIHDPLANASLKQPRSAEKHWTKFWRDACGCERKFSLSAHPSSSWREQDGMIPEANQENRVRLG